jgi:outer membrane protein TolC
MITRALLGTALLGTALLGTALPAQDAAVRTPTVPSLGALHRAAEQRDPRAAQSALLRRQSSLRVQTLSAERLPGISATAVTQYLSDVPGIGAVLPGVRVPTQPNQQYDAYLAFRQRLHDPTRAARARVEAAQLSEQLARLQSTVFRQRQLVNDAYFAVLRADVQAATIGTTLTDLAAARQAATQRLSLGAATPADVQTVDAEVLRREQSLDALRGERDAARAILHALTGATVPDSMLATALHDSDAIVIDTGARRRPEYAQFAAARTTLTERAAVLARQDRPRVSAFARAGYGRPGLNPLARTFDSYALAGLQVDWAPWTWGTTRREQEGQQLQQDVVATEERAFTRELQDAATRLSTSLDALDRTIKRHGDIIALRERILAEARRRFAERIITVAEVIDRETDLLAARLERDQHLVQRAENRARLQTLLGHDLP